MYVLYYHYNGVNKKSYYHLVIRDHKLMRFVFSDLLDSIFKHTVYIFYIIRVGFAVDLIITLFHTVHRISGIVQVSITIHPTIY